MAKRQQVGAFVLDNESEYSWFVKFYVPSGRGGQSLVKFKAIFRHLSEQRRQEILEEHRDFLRNRQTILDEADYADDDENVDTARELLTFEEQVLRESLVGFSGIKDKDRNEVAFNEESLDMAMQNSWFRSATFSAFMQSLGTRKVSGN